MRVQGSIFCLVMLLCSQIAHAEQYSAKDLLKFVRVSQVLPSPNGKEVAYVTYHVNTSSKDKKWTFSLYFKNKMDQTKLLVRSVDIESIRFSADGSKIIYLAPGKKFQSIWAVDLSTLENNKLYEFSRNIGQFKPSPNNQMIAFMAHTEKSTPLINKPIDEKTNYNNTQLYLLTFPKVNFVKPITNASMSITSFDWSPDSKSIVFSSQPREGVQYANKNKIMVLNLENGEVRKIPYTDQHAGIHPSYSPDGKWIAFASNLSPSKSRQSLNDDVLVNNQVCVAETTSLEMHCLSNTFNQRPDILGWNSTSNAVLVLDAYKSKGYYVYALNIDATKPAKLLSNIDGFIEPLTISLNQNHTALGFGYEHVSIAPEAFVSSVESFQPIQISHLNDTKLKVSLGNTKVINWSSFDGI